jgi:23S rRNA pseudoU1915 N3-methylase RlmH
MNKLHKYKKELQNYQQQYERLQQQHKLKQLELQVQRSTMYQLQQFVKEKDRIMSEIHSDELIVLMRNVGVQWNNEQMELLTFSVYSVDRRDVNFDGAKANQLENCSQALNQLNGVLYSCIRKYKQQVSQNPLVQQVFKEITGDARRKIQALRNSLTSLSALKLHTCSICGNDEDEENLEAACSEHVYCKRCIFSAFNDSLSDVAKIPVVCSYFLFVLVY